MIKQLTHALPTLSATALYLAAALLLWRGLRRSPLTGGARLGLLSLAFGAVVLHALVVFQLLVHPGGLDLRFVNALSLVSCMVALLFVLAAVTRPIESLGVLILPLAAGMLVIGWLWPGSHAATLPASPLLSAHIIISLLAYSLFSIAVIQSLALAIQARALRSHQPHDMLRALPPLETMEGLMFQMIAVGFLLLTLTLVSGAVFSEELFGKPLRFTHHVILSLIAWGVFGVLLLGHWRFGWRGRTALRWTLSGFTLLVLGYFGSKFVLEVILRR